MVPTSTTYGELQVAFDTFNASLFDGQLPPCLLTLQREKRTYGYFSAKRFGTRAGQTTDEIALNPEYFAVVPVVEVLQTVAHEMTHLWQSHFGKPGRARYHNAEWADKMESIGLMPSSTGLPGGRRVGDIMADYVIPNGRFAAAVDELLTNKRFGITWFDRFTPQTPLHPVATAAAAAASGISQEAYALPASEGVQLIPKTPTLAVAKDRSNRVKYTCSGCGLNAWGKPDIRLGCIVCNIELAPVCGDETAPDLARSVTSRNRPRSRGIGMQQAPTGMNLRRNP
jgi:predicted SprT family Zn-dependent metalloprotease